MSRLQHKPSVTVIILHYNEFELTKECTYSVLNTEYPYFDILIVDNGSTNNSPHLLQKEFKGTKGLRIITSKENLFFAGGFNFGAHNADGDYVIFLSNDIVVDPMWIDALVNSTKNKRKVLIQPEIRSYQNRTAIDNVGGHYSIWGLGVGISHRTDNGGNTETSHVDFASATTFMMNRSFFLELGGFDPWYRSHYEDVDLSLRAKKQGGECLVCYKSLIYHKGSATYKKHAISSETLLDVRKNRVYTVIKNFTGIERAIRLILCLVTFIPLILQDIASKDKKRALLSVKAIYAAFFSTRTSNLQE